ncbi:DNA-3-methyladenine glycosylase I [Aestuariibacter salexigens]|uniref:DNA-3-methyladenine glycosylase I n=1 Tax=Aestuariibacter salexigens TaxID=226010 RepID=UPI00040735D6|nr:DNA-3-methyladenine glycosylase I [Aestuariibacter salexigens]
MSRAEPFSKIYQRASQRKGGDGVLESLLGAPLTEQQLARVGDDRFLAEFTRKVFQSGFVWRIINQKWPDFERLFFNFDIEKVLLMPDEMLEQRAQDKSIVRNFNKIKTIRDNALMIDDVRSQHGSFAQFVAAWPGTDIVGLWEYLKKHGARLGGNTGPYALRFVGKDTFLLSKDVVDYFRQHNLITGSERSKSNLATIQKQFNDWQQQSGRSLQAISQVVAFSCGDNHVN